MVGLRFGATAKSHLTLCMCALPLLNLVRYVAAATGPKDVVLVLDTSGSMGEPASMVIPKGEKGETLLQMMQKAAKRVLNTLTHNDYVAVVR